MLCASRLKLSLFSKAGWWLAKTLTNTRGTSLQALIQYCDNFRNPSSKACTGFFQDGQHSACQQRTCSNQSSKRPKHHLTHATNALDRLPREGAHDCSHAGREPVIVMRYSGQQQQQGLSQRAHGRLPHPAAHIPPAHPVWWRVSGRSSSPVKSVIVR